MPLRNTAPKRKPARFKRQKQELFCLPDISRSHTTCVSNMHGSSATHARPLYYCWILLYQEAERRGTKRLSIS